MSRGGGGGGGHGFGMNVDDLKGKIYDRKLYGRLFVYVKPYMHIIVMAFVVMLLLAFIEIYLPLVTKTAMDDHIISNRSILVLDTKVEKEGFEKRYGKLKFKRYTTDNIEYVVVPTKKRKLFDKTELEEYVESGAMTKAKYFFADNTPDKLALITKYEPVGRELIILSKAELAFSSVMSKRFEKSDWLKLRERDTDKLMYYGMIYLIFILLQFCFNYLQVVMTTFASQHAMNDLRKDLFGHLQKMPVSYFDHNPVGRLVTRVTNDIRTLDEMLATGAITIIQDVIKIIAIMILMLNLNVQLSLVSFSLIPVIILLIVIYKRKIRPIYREVRKKVAILNATLAEHMSGSKIIQIFNQYSTKRNNFKEGNDSYFKTQLSQLTLNAFFNPLIRICSHLAVALLIWYGGGKILDNVITIGLFMAFSEYVRKLFEPINQFSQKFDILQAALTGAERIFGLIDEDQDDYRHELENGERFEGSIEFKNVWLAYNKEEWVLKDVSFKINPGEKVALVGHTGSGKTSIVNLILGMYPYQKGEIL
ncbi:MAG: ABC transporter transmembrane domain-containing protein, partial [Candidatus Zophobacter franzmannii]|nr:ABC transporter transmembrane domain-containing protein [Candidatus Zophobacter franzmannii]